MRFNIRVNFGPKQYYEVKTDIYRDAAASVPAKLGLSLPVDVEIWVESLLPEYGPYRYRIEEDEYGRFVVYQRHAIPARKGLQEA